MAIRPTLSREKRPVLVFDVPGGFGKGPVGRMLVIGRDIRDIPGVATAEVREDGTIKVFPDRAFPNLSDYDGVIKEVNRILRNYSW